jgi:hypothetical protein
MQDGAGNVNGSPQWDCRWPDPVALKVAAQRILAEQSADRTDLNRRLDITVRMEPPPPDAGPGALVRALLVTPWAVERIYWANPAAESLPIESAYPLEGDASHRVSKGQGVLLRSGTRTVPVLIAWEPETGHHFVEALRSEVQAFEDPEEALAAALGTKPPPPPRKSISGHMNTSVSRRRLIRWFRPD